MKIINEQLLDETQAKALQSPRLRMNYNFHEKLDDPINRLLNAMEPGTYLRPHRHLNPAKDEIFLLLRGKVAVFLFDEEGNITENDTESKGRRLWSGDQGRDMARASGTGIRIGYL